MSNESLTSFIEAVCGESHLRVEDDLGDGFVRLRSAEAERRQAQHDIRSTEDIVIEMLRNARDAHAKSLFVAISREGDRRRICMIDDGDGVPAAMQKRIFEPRVTSKLDTMHMDAWGVHGRGMALFSIASNAESASVVTSAPGMGTSMLVETDLGSLPEKTDQSTLPRFVSDDDGTLRARGPRNIARMVAEFAYEHRESLSVYCGSPTDIAATLYAYGQAVVSSSVKAFCQDPEDLPVVKRLCLAGDPAEFAELAESIGLDMSERSARRILDGSIPPLPTIAETILVDDPSTGSGGKRKLSKKALTRDARGLKIDAGDLEEFTRRMKRAYGDVADRYYLEGGIEPEVHVGREEIVVRFPVRKIL